MTEGEVRFQQEFQNLLELHDFEKEKELGINCDENPTHIAVVYCLKCETNFCEQCFDTIHANSLRSHQKVGVSKKPEKVTKCPVHPHNVSELFCLDPACVAPSRIMCTTCHQYEQHRGHKYCMIKEEVDRLKSRLNMAIDASGKFIKETENTQICAETALQSYNSAELDLKIKMVQDNFNEMVESYKAAHIETLASLEKKFLKMRETIESDIQKVISAKQKQEEWRSEAQRLLKLDTCDFLASATGSLIDRCMRRLDIPTSFLSSSVIGFIFPPVPKYQIDIRVDQNIAFFPMGDEYKMHFIINWMLKNSGKCEIDRNSDSFFEFKNKQVKFSVRSDLKAKLPNINRFVILVDHYSSQEQLDVLYHDIELLMNNHGKDIVFVFAVNKWPGHGKNLQIEQEIKNRTSGYNCRIFYYDHKFEEHTMPLIDFVLNL